MPAIGSHRSALIARAFASTSSGADFLGMFSPPAPPNRIQRNDRWRKPLSSSLPANATLPVPPNSLREPAKVVMDLTAVLFAPVAVSPAVGGKKGSNHGAHIIV